MTQNQINYRNAIENARHNKQMENLQWMANRENIRHNVATENENAKHNRMSEGISQQGNVITASHYNTMDTENIRHNAINESITSEYNRGQLGIASVNASTNAMNAATNRMEAQTHSTSAAYQNALNEQRTQQTKVETQLAPWKTGVQVVGGMFETAVNVAKYLF